MTGRLFGIETEYAFSALSKSGKPLDSYQALTAINRIAAVTNPSLPSHSGGVFLGNGSRLYRDGAHQEFAGPECTDPWQAVAYALAGDRILANVAAELARESAEVGEATFYKTNVDYSGSGTSWGTHENYLVEGNITLF